MTDLPDYELEERRSTIEIGNRKLVCPPAALRNEDRQFFHHELSFANGANHARPGRCEPLFRHFLPGVATPALHIGVARESASIDFGQVVIVQPRFASTVDVVAVIEHETSAVRMPEIFEIHDLELVSRLSVVDIIDDLMSRAKPNQIDIKF